MSQLGKDLLGIFRGLISMTETDEFNSAQDALAKYFLIEMGLSIDYVDESDRKFYKDIESGNLDDFDDVIRRLTKFLARDGNEYLKCVIVSDLATLLQIQDEGISDNQNEYLDYFQEIFDMKPSEFQKCIQKGINKGIGLIYFSEAYSKRKNVKVSNEIISREQNE